jgi:hypothetical protein
MIVEKIIKKVYLNGIEKVNNYNTKLDVRAFKKWVVKIEKCDHFN